MSHIFGRHCSATPPVAVGGEGCYLIDSAGKRYLDGSGGAAVSCLGHGDGEIIRAIKDQMDKVAFAHTGFFTSEPAEKLADLLIQHAPGSLDRVYFVSGGSEAVESALAGGARGRSGTDTGFGRAEPRGRRSGRAPVRR